jgi:hypothetical protein
MPSSTEKQRNYIFYLRGKYKSKENTPEDEKWIWESGWEKVKENKIRTKYIIFFPEAKTVDGFESPEPGDLPEAGADMLANIYAERRKAGDDKEKAAKIAWSAVRQKYPKEG